MEETDTCPNILIMMDEEYRSTCVLEPGHDLPHCDNRYHWDDEDDTGIWRAHD